MVLRLIVRPEAQADIDAALAWYHQQGPELAPRLLAEVDAVFERICENPQQFPLIEEPVRRSRKLFSRYTDSDPILPVAAALCTAFSPSRRFPITCSRFLRPTSRSCASPA